MRIKEIHTATLMFEENNVVLIKFKDGVRLGAKEAKDVIDAILDFPHENRFCLLTDARDIFSSMDAEGRAYLANHKEINEAIVAHAIVINSIATRLVAQVYIGVSSNKYKHPRKIFSNMEKANLWLRRYF